MLADRALARAHQGFSPPLPDRGEVAAYNPQVHPALSDGDRLVLSYDVNWLDATRRRGAGEPQPERVAVPTAIRDSATGIGSR